MDESKLEWSIIVFSMIYLIGLQAYCNIAHDKIHQSVLTIEKCEYEIDGYTRIVFKPSLGTPYHENLRFIGKYDFKENSTYLIDYRIEYDHRFRTKDVVNLIKYWEIDT